jgi:hypothetical protein
MNPMIWTLLKPTMIRVGAYTAIYLAGQLLLTVVDTSYSEMNVTFPFQVFVLALAFFSATMNHTDSVNFLRSVTKSTWDFWKNFVLLCLFFVLFDLGLALASVFIINPVAKISKVHGLHWTIDLLMLGWGVAFAVLVLLGTQIRSTISQRLEVMRLGVRILPVLMGVLGLLLYLIVQGFSFILSPLMGFVLLTMVFWTVVCRSYFAQVTMPERARLSVRSLGIAVVFLLGVVSFLGARAAGDKVFLGQLAAADQGHPAIVASHSIHE